MIDDLRTELIWRLRQADFYMGVHAKVAKRKIYSGDTIRKFRCGDKRLADTKKVKRLLRAYETELERVKHEVRKLEVI